MRVLVLAINYWPDQTGIAPFITGRCEYLASRGHQVSVVTGMPYYPQWRIPDPYRRKVVSREDRNGVDLYRSWLYVPRSPTTVRRIVHEASFVAGASLRALLGSGFGRPDLIFVVSPPLALGLSAAILSRLWGVPFVFHVADLQPDAAVNLAMLRSGPVVRALYALERFSYRNATKISTLNEPLRDRIIRKGISPEKVIVLSDWVDPELFAIPAQGGGNGFREQVGLNGDFLVVHAGNMGVKQGLDVVLGAAEFSRGDRQITYVLVGDGAARSALEVRARTCSLRNVRFLALQPADAFRDLLAQSDLCLVTQQKCVADIVFPSKVLTLLAAARAVVASVNPSSEVARVIGDSGAGVVVAPEDPRALYDAIRSVRNDRGARIAMGLRGRKYARRHWSRESILYELETELVRVTHVAAEPAGEPNPIRAA
jgi:putative colanic acid biosynthesis glycosyltransferase WcaI